MKTKKTGDTYSLTVNADLFSDTEVKLQLLDREGKMKGSVMILDFASRDQLDAYLESEPYIQEHVWEKIEVEPINVVIR